MNRVSPKLTSQSGVSLVELIVVILVISIVASLALMSRGSANEQFQRQNASRELKVAFERARFDSVRRRAFPPVNIGDPDPRARVVVNAASFELWLDKDLNGNAVDAEKVTIPIPAGIVYEANVGTLPRTIFFNHRGEAEPSADADRVFLACNGACSSAAPNFKDVILVTRTGTVNLLTGGSVPTPFPSPPTSTVGTSESVDPFVVLP